MLLPSPFQGSPWARYIAPYPYRRGFAWGCLVGAAGATAVELAVILLLEYT